MPVYAGSQAHSKPHFPVDAIAAFAKQVEHAAAAEGARVFILARIGDPEDELPQGIHYTHTAFAVYSSITTADGRSVPGYAIYNLYQKAKDGGASELVIDYPIDFFAGVYRLKAGVIIPTPAMQDRLLAVITSPTYKKLHNSHYSIVANPYNSQFQNCTEHTLDVINAAIYKTDDIRQIKANTRAYFTPQKVHVSPLKLLAGSLFVASVHTSDQHDGIQTSTFTTIAHYLRQYHLVKDQLTITPDGVSHEQ
jgi:hypothetical protein